MSEVLRQHAEQQFAEELETVAVGRRAIHSRRQA
jgi:hypothetical protein